MAVVHRTTLKPTKLELLTDWLPSRTWYVGGGRPRLAKAGGFRLDDPAGEVGIEFLVATDESGDEPVSYLVPLSYRGAALDGAEHALVGTTEHGVLGRRWVYDGCHDPVLVAQLWDLIAGRVQAQAQSESDRVDRDVTRSYAGPELSSAPSDVRVSDHAGETLLAIEGTAVRLHRVLRPAAAGSASPPDSAAGHVGGSWQRPDGRRDQGYFVTVAVDDHRR